MDQNHTNNASEKDGVEEKDMGKETKVCPMCGGNMKIQGEKWVCEGCKHEMPV